MDPLAHVVQALNNNGYVTEQGELESATFVGMSSSAQEMYDITFFHEGELETGRVFVWESPKGMVLAEY